MRAKHSLATGASVVALAFAVASPGKAQSIEGERQTNSGADAISIFELDAADPPFLSGEVAAPGATAYATVSCAEFGTCTNPGAIWLTAQGTNSGHNLIDIDGVATITAFASASGPSASANAAIDTAVRERASGLNGASNDLAVGGNLTINGVASAEGTTGDAFASALLGVGIAQYATASSGPARADVENEGSIAITLVADADAASGQASAFALIDTGIAQHALGSSTAPVDAAINNEGMLDIGALASASGQTADAAASVAIGIMQWAAGSHPSVHLENSGGIAIDASGYATGEHAQAAGLIGIGVNQHANGADADASLDNGGRIELTAVGMATADADGGTFDALAQASIITAIAQQVSGGSASAFVKNSGDGLISIDISAGVNATTASGSGGDGNALARLGEAAIHQDVDGFKGPADAEIANSGTISVAVSASALADGLARATANASGVFLQDAVGKGRVSASLGNSGIVDVTLDAKAVGGTDGAAAAAYLNGMLQIASASTFESDVGRAYATIVNDGTFDIDVGALAYASGSANAAANIGLGLIQLAAGSAAAAESIANGGLLSLAAQATAEAGTVASAQAGIGFGLLQFVLSDGTLDAHFGNTETVALAAHAAADGSRAYATGDIFHALSQIAQGGVSAIGSVDIENHSLIDIDVKATAVGTQFAHAEANFGIGNVAGLTAVIFQLVQAGGSAAATILNDGMIHIAAHGQASALGTGNPDAFASVFGFGGITQAAIAQTSATTFGITTSGGAIQTAASQTRSGPASAQITNTGVLSFAVSGKAVADGRAEAAALMINGITQIADGDAASVDMLNQDTILFAATATATGGGPAQAQASVGAINQIAFSLNGEVLITHSTSGVVQTTFLTEPAGPATAALHNEGDILLSAIAHAVGGSADTSSVPLSAVAFAFGDNIFQSAVGEGALASLSNSGSIISVRLAEADGPATARALSTGMLLRQVATDVSFEHVYETGAGHGLATAHSVPAGEARVEVLNSGELVLSLVADADGGEDGYATVLGAAISQLVLGATAEAVIDNVGTIMVGARAEAAGNTAIAVVDMDGILQNAVAIDAQVILQSTATVSSGVITNVQTLTEFAGSALASIDNSGTIDIRGMAQAEGSALASAGVFDPFIIRQAAAGDTGQVTIDNNGTLSLVGRAEATAAGTAGALVNMSAPVVQLATATTAGGEARASMNNGGTIDIAAIAMAEGDLVAVARAIIGSEFGGAGIVQSVGGYDVASVAITNTADMRFSVAAVADAVPDEGTAGNAQASATVLAAIHQHASAMLVTSTQTSVSSMIVANSSADPTGTARASFVNTALIDIAAAALAEGGPTAQAYGVIAAGISQEASGATATASFVNGGTLDIAASGKATGSQGAVALAMANGIDQRALAFATSASLQIGSGLFNLTSHGIADGVAHAELTNTATINLSAMAQASGGQSASSGEYLANPQAIIDGIYQLAVGSDAAAKADNQGSYSIGAGANAKGELASASVGIIGVIAQSATAVSFVGVSRSATTNVLSSIGNAIGSAEAQISNSGSISVVAHANSEGSVAFGVVAASGLGQSANGKTALAEITNEGDIEILLAATANGTTLALASILASGFRQSAVAADLSSRAEFASTLSAGGLTADRTPVGEATLRVINEGTFVVSAAANAVATVAPTGSSAFSNGFAGANIFGGSQHAVGTDAEAMVSNIGTIAVAATVDAEGVTVAVGSARVLGLLQEVSALAEHHAGVTAASGTRSFINVTDPMGAALASVDNQGLLLVTVGGTAAADVFATMVAAATGIGQSAAGDDARASVDNDGTLQVIGNASAMGDLANATARIVGVVQVASAVAHQATQVFTPTQSGFAITSNIVDTLEGPAAAAIENVGTLRVLADAYASGVSAASAVADAVGVSQSAAGTANAFSFLNSGTLRVSAVAEAAASPEGFAAARAIATGYYAQGVPGATIAFANTGNFIVTASASGAASESAHAAGISVVAATTPAWTEAGWVTGTIDNSGILMVSAVLSDGDAAEATGIRVVGPTSFEPPFAALSDAGDDLTITNDGGSIIVRESGDGGETWRRGVAIDVSAAPNPTVVNLLGDGTVYGNINLKDNNDLIIVAEGETSFDGIVNDQCLPPGGAGDLVLDGESSACGVGTLAVEDGGSLFLRDDRLAADDSMYDGPSYLFVSSLTVADGGKIVFELQPASSGEQPLASIRRFSPMSPILRVRWKRGSRPRTACSKTNISGTMQSTPMRWPVSMSAQCAMDGPSLLLEFDCIADDFDNIDLALTRVAFGDVSGLNENGRSVGEGLECIYDPDLTGGIAAMFADLFQIDDPADYNEALNQLAGASYASYLNSFASLGVHYNDILARATECEVPALAGSALECRVSRTHLWAQVDLQTRKTDGDIEAGGSDGDRWSAIVGFDMNVGPQAVIGASLGKVANRVDFEQYGERIKGDGHQLGLYGTYDPGAFYLKAMSTYSWFDGDSRRRIDLTSFGGTTLGDLNGDPDVNLWTLGLRAGYRFALSPTSVLTPYLNLDHASAKLEGFTEAGLDGPELTVFDSRESRTSLTGGIKWAGDIGGVIPEANLGYRNRFGDKRSEFTAAFLGDEHCSFDIISESGKRGAFLAGLSLGGKAGPVDVRAGYEGLFNGDTTSHSAFFKLVLPLGRGQAPSAARAGR